MNVRPTDKTVAATVGAAVAVIAVWVLEATAGVAVPAGVEAAFVTIFTFAVSWFVPEHHPTGG